MLKNYINYDLVEKVWLQIWPCLFMVGPITLNQLKSLTSIDTFSCLGGRELARQTTVWEVPVSGIGYKMTSIAYV